MPHRAPEFDSGWIGAGPDDDLDERMSLEDEEWDRHRSHVETVLGPVAPAALGPVLAGEPLSVLAGEAGPGATDALDGRHALLAELEDAYASGARTVVAVPTGAAGESDGDVAWWAGRSQLHLVRFALFEGPLARSDALPAGWGGIVVPAAEKDRVEAAAAWAAKAACPLRILAHDASDAARAVAWAAGAGMPVERLTVGGCDWLADPPAAEAALAAGASIVVGTGRGADDGTLAADLARLAGDGFGGGLLLTAGLLHPADLLARGGARGLGWPMERIPLALMEVGLDALAVRRILVDNPARTLTIGPGE